MGRHRTVISDSSDEHSDPGSAGSPPSKRRQREQSGEDIRQMEEQLEEMRLKIEKEKAEREAERKARQRLGESLRSSMKMFYPTSWKSMKGRDHKNIDSWELPKLQQMETEWHKDYTADLINTMNKGKERTAKKSRATGRQEGRQELMREISGFVSKINDPQELKAKIKELEKTVAQEVANYKK